ncbi:MAG TPA: hypothetical protein VIW72_10010 [Burkholderiales bacterium]
MNRKLTFTETLRMYLKTINMGSEMSLLTIGRSVSPIIASLLRGSAAAVLFFAAEVSAQEVEKKTEPPAPTQANLVKQANAPISDLLQIRFQDSYAPVFQGAHGQGNVFSINPIIPVPEFAAFPFTQLLSLLIPAAVTTSQGVTGFGDLKLLDFVLVSRDPEFVWGIGPVFIFPSATDRTTGQGKWQAGPAAGAAYNRGNLAIGVLAQNPISFAGENDRSSTNFLILQPFATYQLGAGWFLKTEPSMLFNWRTHGNTLPVNLGVGRVFKIGNQTVNCFVEPFWNASNDGPAPRYGITFGFYLLYPNIYQSQ